MSSSNTKGMHSSPHLAWWAGDHIIDLCLALNFKPQTKRKKEKKGEIKEKGTCKSYRGKNSKQVEEHESNINQIINWEIENVNWESDEDAKGIRHKRTKCKTRECIILAT